MAVEVCYNKFQKFVPEELMLKIQNLTKKYGDKPAVDDLTLHIAPGELCAFIGHNRQ